MKKLITMIVTFALLLTSLAVLVNADTYMSGYDRIVARGAYLEAVEESLNMISDSDASVIKAFIANAHTNEIISDTAAIVRTDGIDYIDVLFDNLKNVTDSRKAIHDSFIR